MCRTIWLMKIVINAAHGGFSLSPEAIERIVEKTGQSIDMYNIPRNDPLLVETVETLGEKANGDFAELKIVEIPDDVDWGIQEYDGWEWVAEKHRTWH